MNSSQPGNNGDSGAKPTSSTREDEDSRERRLQAREYHLDQSSHRNLADVPQYFSASFKKGEFETIRRVLDEIENVALKRTSEGFNEFNFSIGVMNCFFIVYMFGAHPEHLWLIYLVEGLYMIPRRFYNMWRAKPLNQALYYLDFCWCMNFTAMFILFLLIMSGRKPMISGLARASFYNALLGVACGALMGANIILPFVACLFHDVNTMTGLFIHVMPPLVMYTLMWHSAEIRESWPSVFDLSYLEDLRFFPDSGPFFIPGAGLDTVAGNSVALYLLWWIPYVCFMILVGIDLPKKNKFDQTPANPKYDTVFHSTMRGGACIAIGKTFRKRSKKDSLKLMEENDFDLVDFFIYMALHMVLALAAFYLIGYPCFISQRFHFWMLVLVAGLAVARGAKRYTYYSTKMYSRILRQQFASVLNETKTK